MYDRTEKLKKELNSMWDMLNKKDGTYESKQEAAELLRNIQEEVNFLVAQVQMYNVEEMRKLIPILKKVNVMFRDYHKQW